VDPCQTQEVASDLQEALQNQGACPAAGSQAGAQILADESPAARHTQPDSAAVFAAIQKAEEATAH